MRFNLDNHSRLWEKVDPLAIRLLASVRPLFRGQGKRPPEPIGTCVMLRVGPARLLLTAAHVVDEFIAEDMLISGDGQLEGIVAEGVHLAPPPGQTRDADIIDAGVLRVQADRPLSVDPHFLTPAALNIEEPLTASRFYLSLGYPIKKTRVNTDPLRVASWPIKYFGRAATPQIYNSFGLHASTHVLIEFDREATATDEGVRAVVDPVGMSGGGVWWWRNATDRYELPDARLTAILIEHRFKEKVLLATRVRYHIALIRKQWPDLVEYLVGFPSP